MEFLATSEELDRTLKDLTGKCERLQWAVAWATAKGNKPRFDLLKKHRYKIEQLTVGIHFHQTDPAFIDEFWDWVDDDYDTVQFIRDPKGVFHPKIYYFDHGENNEWDCIVGSPNFTHGGFKANSEAAVLINHSDYGAEEVQDKILQTLRWYKDRKKFKRMDDHYLKVYRKSWACRQKEAEKLSDPLELPANVKKSRPGSPRTRRKGQRGIDYFKNIMGSNWSQYYQSIKDAEYFEERLRAHEEAKRLFWKYGEFSKINDEERRAISYGHGSYFDLSFYGRVGFNGFKTEIIKNNPKISGALDHIPSIEKKDEVTQDEFQSFAESYRFIFNPNAKNPSCIGTATRLLAFKRPDYFVCFNGASKENLCNTFGISKSLKLQDYWDKVIKRITETDWWNSDLPSQKDNARAWRSRAALLDALFYSPKG